MPFPVVPLRYNFIFRVELRATLVYGVDFAGNVIFSKYMDYVITVNFFNKLYILSHVLTLVKS